MHLSKSKWRPNRPSDASAAPESHKRSASETSSQLGACVRAEALHACKARGNIVNVEAECSKCFVCAWQCELKNSVDRRAGDITLLFLLLLMLRPRFQLCGA